MKSLKIFGIAVVVGLVVVLMMERSAREKLRMENEALSQQLAQLQADNENFSNQLAQAKSQKLSDDKLAELMKLRGEVGVLRSQVGQLGKVRDENQQLRSQPKQNSAVEISPQDQFELQSIHTGNAMKEIALAMHIAANDNHEQFPTNFDQIALELSGRTNFSGNIPLDSFEMVNAGIADRRYPEMIMLRERNPRQTPNGRWERKYGLADGSVQSIYSADGNFSEYEKQHSPAVGP